MTLTNDLLSRTRTRPKRCPACGGRGWRLDLDERCEHCNPCGEEHFPSEVDTAEKQAEHVCPACSWEANPWCLDRTESPATAARSGVGGAEGDGS